MTETIGFSQKLNLPSENSELTTLFLAAGTHQFLLPGDEVKNGCQFIKSGKKQQYRLVTTGDLPETVYLVELCFRNDIVAVQDMESIFEYRSDFCWGNDPDTHTHRLIVISKKEIK